MKQFTLDLVKTSMRPIVILRDWHYIRALLDTGANIPVWVAEESVLIRLGGICIQDNYKFSGFGGETIGKLYVLPNVKIGSLLFPSIKIVACSDMKNTSYSMIISATMFSGLIYEIDDVRHKLNVTIPDNVSEVRNIVLRDSKGVNHVLCSNIDDTMDFPKR